MKMPCRTPEGAWAKAGLRIRVQRVHVLRNMDILTVIAMAIIGSLREEREMKKARAPRASPVVRGWRISRPS